LKLKPAPSPIPQKQFFASFCFSVIPIPDASRRNYRFKDSDIPILRQFRGERVELQLPEGESVSGLKWISVFCRDFNINFGQVNLK
jgi:hypothetical protein